MQIQLKKRIFVILMSAMMSEEWPSGCKMIDVATVTDVRGRLSVVECGQGMPFRVERVFWIYDVPQEASRGGHAHWECAEVVVPVHGAFTIVLDDGRVRKTVEMNDPKRGVLIPAGVWCELKDFRNDAVLLVMASHPYDAQGYEHSYESFKRKKDV